MSYIKDELYVAAENDTFYPAEMAERVQHPLRRQGEVHASNPSGGA